MRIRSKNNSNQKSGNLPHSVSKSILNKKLLNLDGSMDEKKLRKKQRISDLTKRNTKVNSKITKNSQK